jgi:hypothetical protein
VNRRTQEVLDLIKDNKDPLVALSELITNNQDPSIVATASSILAPYLHSKRGTLQAPRYVEDVISIPDFANIEEAQNFLADIARRAGAGELELASANDISNLVKNWVLSVTAQDELQLKIAKENPQGPQEIHIRGGLPELPGTAVIWDETAVDRNGRKVIDHALNDSLNGANVTPTLPQSDSRRLTHCNHGTISLAAAT